MPMAENYYENLSDTMLSDIVGNSIMGIEFMERVENRISYATSLDACREAIEKFCNDKRILYLFRQRDTWRAEAELKHDTKAYEWLECEHQNPARAACIAMLKAKE